LLKELALISNEEEEIYAILIAASAGPLGGKLVTNTDK